LESVFDMLESLDDNDGLTTPHCGGVQTAVPDLRVTRW
jgi:hypothetical protein